MRILASILLLLAATTARAQQWPPELTEAWDPEPPIVTPGEGIRPPSDAIVLFGGKDLSAWQSSKKGGGPAPWKVENGAFEVAKDSGGIETRQSFGDEHERRGRGHFALKKFDQ